MTRSDPHGSPAQTDSDPNDISGTDEALSAIALVIGAYRRLRTIPRALAVLVLAGLVMTGIGWLRLYDPIPIVGYVGILDGRFSVLFSPPVVIYSPTNTLFSSLVGLKPQWLAWAIGLELLEVAVVVWASAYVLARLLQRPLTTAAVVRYAGLVALFQLGLGVHIEGAGLLVAIPAFLIWMFVLVRLFALPGLLIAGKSVRIALRHSWRRTTGHGWSLVVVVGLLGLMSHLAMSVPLVGPLGTALVASLHAGAVVVFLDRSGRAN